MIDHRSQTRNHVHRRIDGLHHVGDGRGAEAGAGVDPEFNLSEHRAEAQAAKRLNIEVNGLCVHSMRATVTKTELLSKQPEPPL
jgi:hypothetical protein